jgi:hypothetical protein
VRVVRPKKLNISESVATLLLSTARSGRTNSGSSEYLFWGLAWCVTDGQGKIAPYIAANTKENLAECLWFWIEDRPFFLYPPLPLEDGQHQIYVLEGDIKIGDPTWGLVAPLDAMQKLLKLDIHDRYP